MEVVTYEGWITEGECGENSNALALERRPPDPNLRPWQIHLRARPLAEQVELDIDAYGNYLTVRYFITDAEKTIDELEENLIKQIVGAGEADYHARYSEITGYLWTDEELKVGGHDLLLELGAHIGQFCYLEIRFDETPAAK
jgi:hypothetical protein